MNEDRPMVAQTPSALERALLREGRAYRPPDDLRARTLAGLGLAASAGFVASALTWLFARSWLAKGVLALSTLTLLVGIGASRILLHRSAPTPVLAPAMPAVMPTPVASAGATSTSAPSVPSTPQPHAASSLVAAPPPPARASASNNSALRAELAALDAVRATLANDDPAAALSFLATYFHAFPRGRLHFEAEVLRIDALAKAGKTSVAGRYAREFLRHHPNSVLTARVRPYAEP